MGIIVVIAFLVLLYIVMRYGGEKGSSEYKPYVWFENKTIPNLYICSECDAIVQTDINSIYSGTVLQCNRCGRDTVVLLCKSDDYLKITEFLAEERKKDVKEEQ